MEKQIAVVGHKPFEVPSDSAYLGIQVGNGPDIPSLIRDNTGDNISSKTPHIVSLPLNTGFGRTVQPASKVLYIIEGYWDPLTLMPFLLSQSALVAIKP